MKITTPQNIKTFLAILLLALFIMPSQMTAQRKRLRKKQKTQQTAPTPKKKKEKTLNDFVKSSKPIDGLFKLYRDTITGSLKMTIKEDQLGKEYIYFSQIANGVLDAGRFRGSYFNSSIFKVQKFFNKIEFIFQNTNFYFDPKNPLSKAKEANTSPGLLQSLKVVYHDKKQGLYLINADDLFLKETFKQIKPSSRPGSQGFRLGSLDRGKTKITAIKNYPENTNIQTEYVYSSPSVTKRASNAVTDPRNVSIKVFHSLMTLPSDDYKPRFDDPRVGFFTTQVDDKTSTSVTPYRDLVHRWRLQKKDPNAAISDPIKPITFWIENTTPLEWRETIKIGVLQWNKAFEKAGFKNALVVKRQPDNATWDAGDIRYNVLRWTSSPQTLFGGYGPSFVNPRTGEILGADIMLDFAHFSNRVFYDKIYNHNAHESEEAQQHNYCAMGSLMQENIAFGVAAANITGASDFELKRIKRESMIALIMHEVGHTLGLSHNMKASQLYTPDQLADPNFIQGKCLTASVMDYATINITRDRSKQGLYDNVTVGPYDIWAIQFGYTPFKSKEAQNALLNESTKKIHIFGNDADDMRSPGKGIDPRVMINDQSSDAIRYSIDRINLSDDLIKTAKAHFIKNGKSYQELLQVYSTLSSQKRTAADVISRYIGGVYIDRAMAGQPGATQPFTPVSLKEQKRAMNALKDYVFAPDAFKTPKDLYNYLAQQRRGFSIGGGSSDPKPHALVLSYQKRVLDHILHQSTLQRISDSELYGNQYTLATFMTDLNNAIFKADIYGQVNSFRQNLQLAYTKRLIDILVGKSNSSYDSNIKSMTLYNLKRIRTMASNTAGDLSSKAHKQLLKRMIDNSLKEIK